MKEAYSVWQKESAEEYVRGDCCYAVVDGHNSKGSYLRLDNGQGAFSYNAGNLRNGAEVLCTIVKSASGGKRALAKLESICATYDFCA